MSVDRFLWSSEDPLVLGKRTFAKRSDNEEPYRNENEKREIEKNTCVNENWKKKEKEKGKKRKKRKEKRNVIHLSRNWSDFLRRSRRCSRGRDDTYGRYCQPSSRSPYGTHQHSQHSHQMYKEEGIYATADPDRGSNTRGETPDSERYRRFCQYEHELGSLTFGKEICANPPGNPTRVPPNAFRG